MYVHVLIGMSYVVPIPYGTTYGSRTTATFLTSSLFCWFNSNSLSLLVRLTVLQNNTMIAATAARRITLSPRALVRTAGAKRRMGHDAHGEGHHPHVSGIENENMLLWYYGERTTPTVVQHDSILLRHQLSAAFF